jgi:hypothetical protein
MAFQQLAEPNVGTLLLIGVRVPLLCTEYDEMADEFGALVPVSETTATSFRTNPALPLTRTTIIFIQNAKVGARQRHERLSGTELWAVAKARGQSTRYPIESSGGGLLTRSRQRQRGRNVNRAR